jgi:hypothetical protein
VVTVDVPVQRYRAEVVDDIWLTRSLPPLHRIYKLEDAETRRRFRYARAKAN